MVWSVPIPYISVMILSIAYICHSIHNAEHPCPVTCNILLYYQNQNNFNSCRAAVFKTMFQDFTNTVCFYGKDCFQACLREWSKEALWATNAGSRLTFLACSSDQSSDSEVSTTSSGLLGISLSQWKNWGTTTAFCVETWCLTIHKMLIFICVLYWEFKVNYDMIVESYNSGTRRYGHCQSAFR
jgi:hypothetical protein